MQSTRCCQVGGRPFATVSVLRARSEIHVVLNAKPCCQRELTSFFSILSILRGQLRSDTPFYILYDLSRCCTANRSGMATQEEILQGATACVVILTNPFVRRVVQAATSLNKTTRIHICATTSEGLRWLKTERAQGTC
jgi:hypothetical protein